jgi:hypothetical protein
MKKQTVAKSLHLIFSAALIVMLALGLAPARTARAEVMTSTSDLIVTVVSAPRHVRDCEVFEVTFTVTNLGPDLPRVCLSMFRSLMHLITQTFRERQPFWQWESQ